MVDVGRAHVDTWQEWWTLELAARLEGTCISIPEAAQTLGHPEWEDDYIPMLLDQHIFECVHCNWWFEQSENVEDAAGQWSCSGCTPDDDDD